MGHGPSSTPSGDPINRRRSSGRGGAAINQLCRVVDADLKVYEMNLETPTGDIVEGPALGEAECAKAMAYGMMAVEPGIDAIALGEIEVEQDGRRARLRTAPGPTIDPICRAIGLTLPPVFQEMPPTP